MQSKIELSIVIVNYKVEKELMACVSSIFKSKPKVLFEIIVVDNGKDSKLEAHLKKDFLQAKYVRSPRNIGFGAGNNLGAKLAKGDFLFFLNPDTLIKSNSIDILFNFINNNPKAGMVAPLLFDPLGNAYRNQGSDEHNLINTIITSSFVNKLYPNNPISRKFFHSNWNKKSTEEFDVVPGTAFMIGKSLFEKVGMFDENFFLYFEEYDLAKRIKTLGYKNYIIPGAKVMHTWKASTRKRKDIRKIFSESRYLFFKKHYGTLFASIASISSNVGKYEFMLCLILGISVFLGLFRIKELMTFIGDQGWFYLSARNMLINGQIPLVGIASSHPWLHQGPFWTYLLSLCLFLFSFDPASGAYLTVILGVLSVLGIYIVGSRLFSKRVGLIASLFYATSPLVVFYMRLPYHTSPIPFFVLIYIFFLHKVNQKKLIFLPLTLIFLSILYNFEISTVSLGAAFAWILGYKLFKKEIGIKDILNKKILTLSAVGLMSSLLPMILYDIRNGFPQTIKFSAWIIYRGISFLGFYQQGTFSINKITIMLNFLFSNFTKLIFAQNSLISFIVLIVLICWTIYMFFRREKSSSYNLIFLLFLVPLVLIVFNQTPSDAYLPIFFPIVILLFSLFIDFITTKKIMLIPVSVFIIIFALHNVNFMFKNNFTFGEDSVRMFALNKRIETAHKILNIVGNKDYNLVGKGRGSEFDSFTMNYEYLTWWMGHGSSKNNENIKIYISESSNGIKVEKN